MIRVLVINDDMELTQLLMGAVEGVTPSPVAVSAETLRAMPSMARDALVLAGLPTLDDQAVELMSELRSYAGNGQLLVVTSGETRQGLKCLPMDAVTPRSLRYLVEKDIETIELKSRVTQAETDRSAAQHLGMELISSVAHDLRAPLNSIIGFAELLGEHHTGNLDHKQIRYVGNIAASGRELLQLIEDIVDLARINTGKLTVESETVEICTLISESIRLLREKIQKSNVAVTWTAPPSSGFEALLDRQRFQQAMYLLLSLCLGDIGIGERLTLSVARQNENICVKIRNESSSNDRSSNTERLVTSYASRWQRLYIEQVFRMHGAELAGWDLDTERFGSLEVRVPGKM